MPEYFRTELQTKYLKDTNQSILSVGLLGKVNTYEVCLMFDVLQVIVAVQDKQMVKQRLIPYDTMAPFANFESFAVKATRLTLQSPGQSNRTTIRKLAAKDEMELIDFDFKEKI
jgi:hypothetical protein